MRFDKVFACAAVLGCASAVNLDTTTDLDAAVQRNWGLGEIARDTLRKMTNADHKALFRAAAKKCKDANGRAEGIKCGDMYMHLKEYGEHVKVVSNDRIEQEKAKIEEIAAIYR